LSGTNEVSDREIEAREFFPFGVPLDFLVVDLTVLAIYAIRTTRELVLKSVVGRLGFGIDV
jgi:hypothetical protein